MRLMEGTREMMEQRIFEMLGEYKTVPEIADELGMDHDEAMPVVRRVLKERGTPQLVEMARSLDRLAAARQLI